MGSLSVRQPAVAGLFYDRDPVQLGSVVDELLSGVTATGGPRPKVLIVPHAGYVYSGATAASAYLRLAPWRNDIRRVVLLGPAHRVYLEQVALPGCDSYASPLGEVPIDVELAAIATELPGVCVSEQAHREEHSLEVQLPFLQRLLGDFSLLPMVVGHCPPGQVAAIIDALWGGPETLIVVSTDLSHFHSYEQAERLDRLTCERLLAHDQSLNGEDACGANALNGLMTSEHGRQLEVELVHRCNSGDSTGDHSRVVGYGAFALY